MIDQLTAVELAFETSEILTHSLPVNMTLTKALDCIFDHVRRIDRGVVVLVNPETGDISESIFRVRESSPDMSPICSWDMVSGVLHDGVPIVINDTFEGYDGDFSKTHELSRIRSILSVPLITGGKAIGVIYVESTKEAYGFQKEDVSLFSYLSEKIAKAIDKKCAGFQSRASSFQNL